MGLFDKFKKKENLKKVNESDYYIANPKFYEGDNGVLGMCTLTEGVLTLLKKEFNLAVDGKKVEDYKLGIFSITENKILGTIDYYKAIEYLKSIAKSNSENYILVELNLKELQELIERVGNIEL